MKKFFSILTVCAMLLSLSVGAFADLELIEVVPETSVSSSGSTITLIPENSTTDTTSTESVQQVPTILTLEEQASTFASEASVLDSNENSQNTTNGDTTNSTAAPTQITFNETSVSLKVGEQEQVTWTVEPADASSELSFKSDNPDVAKVYQGKITAIGVGSTTIVAKSKEDTSVTASITVTVTSASSSTSITISPDSLSLDVGASKTLTATVSPSQAYSWSSENPEIATVSDTGVVKAVASGNTNIVLTALDKTKKSVPVIVTTPVTPETSYTVSVSPNNVSYGTVYLSGDASSAQYAKGATVTVTASPNAGYEIQSWTANGSVISAAGKRSSFSFKADNSYVIVANFAPITSEYTITYSSGAYATAQYVTWSNTFMAGTNAYIDSTQYSRTGYYQDGWTTVDGSSVNSYPYGTVIANISSNYTLYPHWTANAAASYTLTITYNAQYGSVYYGNSYIANGSTVTIAQGQSKTFSFYPSDGYYVWNLNFAGYNIGSCSSYTVSYDSMRGASRTMNVTFASIYSSPKTGDNSNIALWGALAGCAVVGIGVLFVVNKKSSKKSGKDK